MEWFCGKTFWPCTGVAILGAIALPVVRIPDAVGQVDLCLRAIVVGIISELVVDAARIKTHERILSKKERSTCAATHRKRDAVVAFAVGVTIADSLANPAAQVITRRNRVTRGCYRLKIGDHDFVPSGQTIGDVE